VLADAHYNGDATASTGNPPTYTQPTLSWSGPLTVGVTVTYSVTVHSPDTGDLTLDNAAVPGSNGGACPPSR
jgi:hypothetical protein